MHCTGKKGPVLTSQTTMCLPIILSRGSRMTVPTSRVAWNKDGTSEHVALAFVFLILKLQSPSIRVRASVTTEHGSGQHHSFVQSPFSPRPVRARDQLAISNFCP